MKRARPWLMAAALLLITLGLVISLTNPREDWDAALVVPAANQPPGSARLVANLWVARQPAGDFRVFVDLDPTNQRPTVWMPDEDLFCPGPDTGGGACYSIDGRCFSGPCVNPGYASLYRVAARQEGDTLRVLPDRVISGGHGSEPAWLYDLRQDLGLPNILGQWLGCDVRPCR